MATDPLKNFMHRLFHAVARAEFKGESDQQLLQRYVKQRDELAFGALMSRHEDMVWNVCWHILRHRQDTEDAFQATFMTLLRRAGTIVWSDTIEGWLYNVAYKVAMNARMASRRQRMREERRAKMREEGFESDTHRWEVSEVLQKELTLLPDKFRSPLLLCYLEGLTREQAAQRLGITLRNLDARLAQGRERMQKRLSKYGMNLDSNMLIAHLSFGGNFSPVPPGLVEKTLNMVRIVIQSNGALETAGMSAEVAMLVHGAAGVWTLKAKMLVGVLVLSLATVSAGVALYPSMFLRLFGREPSEENKIELTTKSIDDPKSTEMPPRIDRYGDLLPPGALARGGTVRLRHVSKWKEGGAESVLFTRDSQALFTTGRDDPVRLWDVATGQLLRQFGERDLPTPVPTANSLHLMALSPDGATLASSGGGHRLYLWNVATGKSLCQWDAERVAALAFSPDGTMLLTVSAGNVVRVHETATGRELRRCVLEQSLPWDEIWFAISPNCENLVSICDNKTVQLWDIASGKMLHQLPCKKSEIGSAAFVAFSPDGKLVATASAAIEKDIERDADSCDGTVHVWEAATGKEVRQIGSDKAGTWSVAFSPDGKILATGSGAGPIRLWDVATGQKLRECDNYRSHIASLAFSSDGQRLASGASMIDHTARVWEVTSGLEVGQPLGGHTGSINSLSFAPDGQTLISAGKDGCVGVWDAATGRELRPPLRAGDFHAFAGLSPDGKTIASIASVFSPDGKPFRLEALRSPTMIRLWDTATGIELRHFMGLDVKAYSTFLSANGKALVCISYNGSHLSASLWDTVTGKGCALSDDLDTGMPLCAVFSPDSKTIAIGALGGIVSLWDVATCKKIAQYQVHKGWVESLAFAPDGRTLATAGSDTLNRGDGNTDLCLLNRPTIRLWHCPAANFDSLKEISLAPMTAHSGRIYELAFSPDGRTLASAGQDGTVRLWETATGLKRRCFTGHQGEVWCLAFAPDGRRLASGGNDTTFLIWDVTGRLEHGRLRPAHLSTSHLEQLWADLAGADAARAGQAIWTLTAAGPSTVSFLRARLQPASWGVAEKMASYLVSGDKPLVPSRELLCDLRAIEVLEQIGSPEARRLLQLLGSGKPKARKTQEAQVALQRLSKR